MIEPVTAQTLGEVVARYEKARSGVTNEDTDSEAMFVFSSKFDGVYILSTGCGIFWIGVQNAMARMTNKGTGRAYVTVRHALEAALLKSSRSLFYTDEAVERQRWIADRIEMFRAVDEVRLTLTPK